MARVTKRTKITCPSKTEKLNPDNLMLMDDFLMYLKSLQRSAGTIKGYRSDLTILFTYMYDHMGNKPFRELTKRDIIRIQNWLVTEEMSPARIRRFKAAMSSLSNYCENILVDDDPDYKNFRAIVRKVENPALNPVREKTVWTDEEVEGLLNTLVKNLQYEKACFVALAAYGGRRKSELCRFKVSDFDEDKLVCDGALYKSDKILTKGNKYINCYTLAKKFKPYFDMWMHYREGAGIESPWLFPSHHDMSKQMGVATVNPWTEEFTRLTGKNFYMHSLRHSFVSMLARAGIPDGVITDIISWASPDMVKIYNDNPADDTIAMYFKNGDIDASARRNVTDL